ncbi:FecR domain-containing protein [Reichenbachiella sp. MALMAid0571]|uniref:FecR family protein n=1 Tax=Reichenbachiella sp. MALMAid0571 TaxID=3143939 RepID=UPI0032E01681
MDNNFEIEDLVQDESFLQWVIAPNAELEVKWRALQKENPENIETARNLILTLRNKNEDNEIDEDAKNIWSNLQPIVRGETLSQTNRKSVEPKQSKLSLLWKIAASVVLIIGLSLWTLDLQKKDPVVLNHTSGIEKSTPKGVKSTVTLKDGSTVVLNSESTISYHSNYGDSIREITLVGEAFFEVAKNPNKPFIVKTGNISTTALGTSFNISSYPECQTVTVSLATGKVKVNNTNSKIDSYFLTPGEQIKYQKSTHSFIKSRNKDDEAFLWKDGILSFNQADLAQITQKLERWYGVSVDVSVQPKSVVDYDGIFNNQSMSNVLKAMSFSLNFDYRIEEKNIKIMFN